MKKRIFDTMIKNQTNRKATRHPYLNRFNLRMFDEDGGDDKGGDEDGDDDEGGEGAGENGGKAFTQADIDKAVSAALKRERAKAEKKAKEAAEAERLKNMTEAERTAEKLKELEAEVAKFKGEKARAEMASTVRSLLGNGGVEKINDTIVNALVVADDADQTKANVEEFIKSYKAAVAAGIKAAMGGQTPPAGNTRKGGKALTKAEIMAVKDQAERQRLIRENINLFKG